MTNAKEIKRKISSIQNTAKITKAMELISTVKMKKAQDKALSKKEFVIEMLKVFYRIQSSLSDFELFSKKTEWKTLAIVITSNKGLCWGYNINVLKRIKKYVDNNKDEKIDYISMWKKAALFVTRTWNNLIADYSDDFSDNFNTHQANQVMEDVLKHFLSEDYKKVVIFYNHFVNSIKQIPVARDFLPIDKKGIEKYLEKVIANEKVIYDIKQDITEYTVEPSLEIVAQEVIPLILDMMFYDILLEAKASEHSARMVAMKAAKDSANSIAKKLTLAYNKARQAMITKEVSEIVSWVEALKD